MTVQDVQAIPRTFEEAGIHIPAGSSGKISTVCPICSSRRKKSRDKCLTVWIETGTWSCNHCQWKGRLFLHSDGTTNRPDGPEATQSHSSQIRDKGISKAYPNDPPRTLTQEEVDSWGEFQPPGLLANLECTENEERAAIMELEGLPRARARVEAGLGIRIFQTTNMQREFSLLRSFNPASSWLAERTRLTILDDMYISPQRDGSLLFFFVDINGEYRTAKRFLFDANGHKIGKPVTIYTVGNGFRPCLYGEHQLMQGFKAWNGIEYGPNTPVVLVESEKSVLLASHHRPEFIWLGASGTKGLTADKAKVLRGRKVTIWYDRDEAGRDGASRAAHILKQARASSIKIIDPFEFWPDKPNGFDIADLISENVQVIHD